MMVKLEAAKTQGEATLQSEIARHRHEASLLNNDLQKQKSTANQNRDKMAFRYTQEKASAFSKHVGVSLQHALQIQKLEKTVKNQKAQIKSSEESGALHEHEVARLQFALKNAQNAQLEHDEEREQTDYEWQEKIAQITAQLDQMRSRLVAGDAAGQMESHVTQHLMLSHAHSGFYLLAESLRLVTLLRSSEQFQGNK